MYITLAVFSSYFGSVIRNIQGSQPETEKGLQYCSIEQLQAFCMYGSLSMSVPSLHRECTDSLHCIQSYIIKGVLTDMDKSAEIPPLL